MLCLHLHLQFLQKLLDAVTVKCPKREWRKAQAQAKLDKGEEAAAAPKAEEKSDWSKPGGSQRTWGGNSQRGGSKKPNKSGGIFGVLQALSAKKESDMEILKYRPLKGVESICEEEEEPPLPAFDAATDSKEAALKAGIKKDSLAPLQFDSSWYDRLLATAKSFSEHGDLEKVSPFVLRATHSGVL